ncbi:glycoside hydrolase family 16 protein [Hyphobacterium sp. HN65]|uniref:Glycoside hydrolase family 16 protein n=1 Tax=Hyphobacterium lacteum TaxID=3116575 RepID=A0ABU7LT75_9PROT|nr:glycoside hydrolase family 16 protein [Hyphobacterium sp. HN65]MEE2526846.1 glycoside hydrolase family 16 protein [Hyphobacterium sp. HN65]
MSRPSFVNLKAAASAGQKIESPEVSDPEQSEKPAILFEDDFSGPELDRSRWNVEGPVFWVNREAQAYIDSPETIRLLPEGSIPGATGKVLELRAGYSRDFETPDGRRVDFLSGRIDTRGKFDFTHGRAAARIRLPDLEGVWPAFWMLGNGEWPGTGEIDILEYVGEPDWVGVAVHGPGYSGETPLVNKYFFADDETAADWHVYEVEWTPEVMIFKVDGRTIYRVTRTMVELYGDWRFDTPKHLILNLAVGGEYPHKINGRKSPYYGVPAATAEAIKRDGAAIQIDWVRVERT